MSDYLIEVEGPSRTVQVKVAVLRIGNRLSTACSCTPADLTAEEVLAVTEAIRVALAADGLPVRLASITKDAAEARRFMGGGLG